MLRLRKLPSLTRAYHDAVLDHYNKPRNVGSFNKNDPKYASYSNRSFKNVGTGLVGAPACGDVMRLQILVDDNGDIIDCKFKTFGCGSAIASSSLVTEKIKGMNVAQASTITNKMIASELSLPPVKLHCSMLAEDAIKSAVADWETKRLANKKSKIEQEKANAESK